MSRSEKIITCTGCDGAGVIETCYHKSNREPEVSTCGTCKGEGRLLRIESVEIKPLPAIRKPLKTEWK